MIITGPNQKLLFERVQADELGAKATLYDLLKKIFLARLIRRLGEHDAFDGLHNLFILVLTAIRQSRCAPEKLVAFAGSVWRRMTIDEIELKVKHRARVIPIDSAGLWRLNAMRSRETNPETMVIARDEALALIQALPPMRRELVERFYLNQQSKEQIEEEMGLTQNQIRNEKSRALEFLRKKAA